ncbi:putative Heat shock protein 70 family [Helianthus anomalus]
MSTKVKATPIGIDLGTTNSCVVAWFDQHDRVEIFPNEQGNTITPSCVAFNDTEHLVGEGANSAGFWILRKLFRSKHVKFVVLGTIKFEKAPFIKFALGLHKAGPGCQTKSPHPENTIFHVKRITGSRFSNIRLQKDIESWPFKVIEGSSDKPMIVLEHMGANKEFSAEEISSMILKNFKEALPRHTLEHLLEMQ